MTLPQATDRIPRIALPEPTLDVSVVVPVRNEIRSIERFLDSLLGQSGSASSIEFLLVDGGSTDGTREAIAERLPRDPRLRLLDNPAGAVSPALNTGLRHSRGRVLVRMDAHAVYQADYIRRCVATLDQTGADAVGGVQIAEPGADTEIARAIAAMQMCRFGTGGGPHRRPGYEGPADSLWLGAFRREVVARIGGFDEALFRSEDNDFYERLRAAGGRLWVSSHIRAHYCCRPTAHGYLSQCYVTGTQIPLTLRRNRRAMAFRHLVPGSAFLSAILLSVAGVLLPYPASVGAWGILAAGAALYVAVDAVAALGVSPSGGWSTVGLLMALFPLSHAAYGFGTLVGLRAMKMSADAPGRN